MFNDSALGKCEQNSSWRNLASVCRNACNIDVSVWVLQGHVPNKAVSKNRRHGTSEDELDGLVTGVLPMQRWVGKKNVLSSLPWALRSARLGLGVRQPTDTARLSFQPRGHGQRGNEMDDHECFFQGPSPKAVTVIIHRESFRHLRVAERSGKMLFVPLRQGENLPMSGRFPGAGLTAGTTSVRLQRDSGAQRALRVEAPKSDHEPTPPKGCPGNSRDAKRKKNYKGFMVKEIWQKGYMKKLPKPFSKGTCWGSKRGSKTAAPPTHSHEISQKDPSRPRVFWAKRSYRPMYKCLMTNRCSCREWPETQI